MIMGPFETFELSESSLRMSQGVVVAGLATAGGSDKHEAVTHQSGIVKLSDLGKECFSWL